MNTIFQMKNNISNSFSLGREKSNQLESRYKSNYNTLREKFKLVINNINNDIQEGIKEKIRNIIKSLDFIFSNDFQNEKILEEIKKFKIEEIESNINPIYLKCQNNFFEIIEQYKKKISDLLNKNKENISIYLRDKSYYEIIREIKKEIENHLTELNSKIIEIIYNIDKEINGIILNYNKTIKYFCGEKGELFELSGFLQFFTLKIGGKKIDLTKALFEEINISCSSTFVIIFKKKGLKSWILSNLSNEQLLENIIDIILNIFLFQIDYILFLLINYITEYITNLKYLMENVYKLIKKKFTKENKEVWNKLFDYYNQKKEDIKKLEIDFYKNIKK